MSCLSPWTHRCPKRRQARSTWASALASPSESVGFRPSRRACSRWNGKSISDSMYTTSFEDTINRMGLSLVILLVQNAENCERLLILVHHVAEKCVVTADDGLTACDPQPLCLLGIFALTGHLPLLESVFVFPLRQGVVRDPFFMALLK